LTIVDPTSSESPLGTLLILLQTSAHACGSTIYFRFWPFLQRAVPAFYGYYAKTAKVETIRVFV